MLFSKRNIDLTESLRKYYNNELSDKERNAIERQALEDPFLKEAMDGYDSNPNSINLFLEKNQAQFGTKRRVTLVIALSVLLLLFAVTSLLKKTPIEEDTFLSDNVIVDSIAETASSEYTDESDVNEYEVLPVEIETLTIVSPSEIVSIEELITSMGEGETELDNVVTTTEDPILILDENNTEEEGFSYVDETIHSTGQASIPSTYMHNLYVVDYREITRHKSDISYKRFEIGGLSADIENSDSESTDLIEKDVQIPYFIYLNKSMSFFAKNDFKKALNRYLVILDQYPLDANALFYGGLSYFNLGRNDNAIQFFDKLLKSDLSAFNEEVNWYKVKTLIRLNNISEAKQLLDEIIAFGGFYVKEAIQLKTDL